jgi:hypothetical protein
MAKNMVVGGATYHGIIGPADVGTVSRTAKAGNALLAPAAIENARIPLAKSLG